MGHCDIHWGRMIHAWSSCAKRCAAPSLAPEARIIYTRSGTIHVSKDCHLRKMGLTHAQISELDPLTLPMVSLEKAEKWAWSRRSWLAVRPTKQFSHPVCLTALRIWGHQSIRRSNTLLIHHPSCCRGLSPGPLSARGSCSSQAGSPRPQVS